MGDVMEQGYIEDFLGIAFRQRGKVPIASRAFAIEMDGGTKLSFAFAEIGERHP